LRARKSTGDLRAALKEAETEPEDARKVAILAPVVARPICLGKDKLQVALAVRDIPNFHDDYIKLFDQLIADDGDEPGIQYQIARFLLSERPEENAHAIAIMTRAAGGGKREAMRELGRIYGTGKLVPVDQAEASKWLFKAARLGDAGALESLVNLILSQQTSLDRPMAGDQKVEKLLQDLAAENSPQVAMLMSKLYLRLADGSPAFRELGKIWTLKAAELGNGQAMLNASDFYATGTHGFDQSNTESTKWLSKAARAGFRGAFEKYAIALQIGFGTQPDVEEAQQWLSKSTTPVN
jgi:TPR repeat protein